MVPAFTDTTSFNSLLLSHHSDQNTEVWRAVCSRSWAVGG